MPEGKRGRIVDLFAGCGGMSLGFEMAGFRVSWANELDPSAADTYEANHPGTPVVRLDAREIDDWALLSSEDDELPVGVVGGPPCQAFSLCGTRDPNDPRGSLFMEFVRCVRQLRPKFFAMENVPGILSMRTKDGDEVAKIIVSTLRDSGYDVFPEVVDAADCGVPQHRERVFFLGFDETLGVDQGDVFLPAGADSHVPAWAAISDLPLVESGDGDDEQPYPSPPLNPYQSWAREGSPSVTSHVAMRHTKRLIARFKEIAPGQSVADVPEEHSAVRRGDAKVKSGKVYAQNNMRVRADRPCPTVAASFQSSFLHPFLHRNFTAREAARIQSFPDRYSFRGARTKMSWEKGLSQYQQIGNAVPPLMAKAVAEAVARAMSLAASRKGS